MIGLGSSHHVAARSINDEDYRVGIAVPFDSANSDFVVVELMRGSHTDSIRITRTDARDLAQWLLTSLTERAP